MFDIAAIDAKAGAPTRKELAYELCSVLNAELCLNGIPIPQITGGRLALLDAIESPIISDKKYSKRDVDIAMFIMMMGKDSVNSIAANIYDNASFEKDLKKLRILLISRILRINREEKWANIPEDIRAKAGLKT